MRVKNFKNRVNDLSMMVLIKKSSVLTIFLCAANKVSTTTSTLFTARKNGQIEIGFNKFIIYVLTNCIRCSTKQIAIVYKLLCAL